MLKLSARLPIMRIVCAGLMIVGVASCEYPHSIVASSPKLQAGDMITAAMAPAPYRAGRYEQRIPETGGTIRFGIGELVFPAGAVPQETTISATVDGYTVAVELEPAGITFPPAAQPILRFAVTPSRMGGRIFYVNSHNIIIDILAAKESNSSLLEVHIPHFSKYIFGVE